MICPCKDCQNKGCGAYHNSCEPYKKWSAERNEINRQKQIERVNNIISDEQIKKHWRNLKAGRTVSRR